jgi:hypothetical protein
MLKRLHTASSTRHTGFGSWTNSKPIPASNVRELKNMNHDYYDDDDYGR